MTGVAWKDDVFHEEILRLVAEEDVDLGVGRERVGGPRVHDVLAALVEIGEHDRRAGAIAPERGEELPEERVPGRGPERRPRRRT